MANNLYVVRKEQTSLTGKTLRDIRGFDYKDEVTGLTLNVRDGDPQIRINGKIVYLAELNKLIKEKGRP